MSEITDPYVCGPCWHGNHDGCFGWQDVIQSCCDCKKRGHHD